VLRRDRALIWSDGPRAAVKHRAAGDRQEAGIAADSVILLANIPRGIQDDERSGSGHLLAGRKGRGPIRTANPPYWAAASTVQRNSTSILSARVIQPRVRRGRPPSSTPEVPYSGSYR
jgi:hypothetical protein